MAQSELQRQRLVSMKKKTHLKRRRGLRDTLRGHRPPSVPPRKKIEDTSNMGRPKIPARDRLKICVRADLDAASDQAMKAEMKASGQTRSRVIRRLVRDGLRELGHRIPPTAEEKAES